MSATKNVAVELAIEPSKTITRFRDFFSTRKDLGGYMDPRLIRIEKGHNPRDYRLPENRAHLDSLKISIASVGVQQPLLCRMDGGQCILVDGESRLTATLELIKEGHEILKVPVMQVEADNEADRIAIAVGANTGKPLSEWEMGNAFKRLRKFGWEDESIAGRFGISEKKVAQCCELADMPQDVKQLLSERAITPALAITTVRRAKRTGGAGVDKATEELKGKAAAAKAAGKKGPVKKERAAATPTEWEQIGRAIFKDFETDFVTEESQEGGFGSEFFSVRLGLCKKLAKLCRA